MRLKDVDAGYATLEEYYLWHSVGLPSFRSRKRFSQQPWNVWYPKRAARRVGHDMNHAPDPRWNPYAIHGAPDLGIRMAGFMCGREIQPLQVPWVHEFE